MGLIYRIFSLFYKRLEFIELFNSYTYYDTLVYPEFQVESFNFSQRLINAYD